MLHHLVNPGSDRSCFRWSDEDLVDGLDELDLHHALRSNAWLGEALADDEKEPREVDEDGEEIDPALSPRCVQERIEEWLLARRRDLSNGLDLVFLDTASISFEAEGGDSLGQRGHSKDKPPDLEQMVVGAVIDEEGRPISCKLLPGNTSVVKTLIPVVRRLERRLVIQRICLVAIRGMIKG